MITNSDIELADRALRKFKSHKPIIAGGYVRDTLLGETPKDIDIFIAGSPFFEERIFLMAEGFVTSTSEYGDYRVYNKGNVQIIFHQFNSNNDLMNDFDIACCECYVDIDSTLHLTDRWKESIENKEHFVRVPKDNPFRAGLSAYHISRVIEKYPWPITRWN